MNKIYKVDGMTCNGCRSSVERALNGLQKVEAKVQLAPGRALVKSEKEHTIQELQRVISEEGEYTISEATEAEQAEFERSKVGSLDTGVRLPSFASDDNVYTEEHYYCPMFCEGETLYEEAGRCPICRMHLKLLPVGATIAEAKEEINAASSTPKAKPKGDGFYCPMQCEGDKIYAKMGDCPVCGMSLVATEMGDEQEHAALLDLKRKFNIALLFTIPIFILSMGDMMTGGFIQRFIPMEIGNWLQFVLSLPVVFYATWIFFVRAWNSFKSGNLNMFSLVGLGAGAAFIFSIFGLLFPGFFPDSFKDDHGMVHLYFEAVVVILTLVMLGQLLEARAHAQTNASIKSLLQLAPTEATLVKDGKEFTVDIKDIKLGNLLRVRPGEKIPVDGKIVEGESIIDESMISGEPVSVQKSVKDAVTAGTINGNKSFVMKAERVGDETILAQIIAMVNQASRSRAPIQNLADRVAKYFVPTVVFSALLTFVLWAWLGKENAYIYGLANALAVMIVACPCALGLATPMSVMVGIGKGAQHGILIKNAESLEVMDTVDVLVVDKTGTLTEGKPSLSNVVAVGTITEDVLLRFAASVNQDSEHPLAQAVMRAAELKNAFVPSIGAFEAITGKGVKGIVEAKTVLLGNEALLNANKVEINEDVLARVNKLRASANTVSFLSINGSVEGYLVISDAIKLGSLNAVKALTDLNIEVIMLTGDNEHTAKAVAKEIGIKNYIAQCLPEDKLNEIKRLQAAGKKVAMAGDGINDAPALAQANVGIAMGTGTDVAIESAGITLLHGDLNGILKVKLLSHKVMRNIKQNLFFAFIYNAIGVPIAAGVLYPFFGILLSPMIAAAAMSFSSVSVISNALRLRAAKL